MDNALLAILISLSLTTLATLIGYYEGDSWDTISDMITRSERLRNAFALFVGLSVTAQYYYCNEMIIRWKTTDDDESIHAYDLLIKFAMILCFGGAVGFAIVSTDIAQNEHMYFAGVSFTGAWIYITVFYKLARSHGRCFVMWLYGGTAFYLTLSISGIVLAIQPSWAHYAEYVFVLSLHAAAICLYVVPASTKLPAYPIPTASVMIPIPTRNIPLPVEFYSNNDNTMQQLRYNGLELTWASQDNVFNTFSNERLSCVTELHWDSPVLTGKDAQGRTASGNPTTVQIDKIKQLSMFYNIPINSSSPMKAYLF